ncbi:hypothetical protein [Krasilnikovia sp. M28-CT-15]|uniref:hypothetical protein n=1 Tax=Krasilnikovia sp. M28-CT-15 TaxID=3373540 RepID=UPI003876E3B8
MTDAARDDVAGIEGLTTGVKVSSVDILVVGTWGVFVLANVGALVAGIRVDRAVARVVTALHERPGGLYPATLLAYGPRDTAAAAWAAVHRARQPFPTGKTGHRLTALALRVLHSDRGLQHIRQITQRQKFHWVHLSEVQWLASRLPGRPQDLVVDLTVEVVVAPAVVISGWFALYLAGWLIARLVDGEIQLHGLIDWLVGLPGMFALPLGVWFGGFLLMLAVQAALWWPARRLWQLTIRRRAVRVLRRELGDAYDPFLADLRRDGSRRV